MDNATTHMLSVQEKTGETRKAKQYLAALAASIGALIAGTLLGWSSQALPHLQPLRQNTTTNGTLGNTTQVHVVANVTNSSLLINSLHQEADFLLTPIQSFLVSSILAIGAMISAFPFGLLTQRVGRKRVILTLSIPFTLTWLVTIFAWSPVMLIGARFYGGIATGGIFVVAPMYISEIAETSIRGTLISFFHLFLTIGIFLSYVVGAWIHWRTLSIVCVVLPPLLFIIIFFMPETPQFLLSKGRHHDAERSLRWLRGPDANVTAELEDMQKFIDDSSRKRGGILGMLTSRAPRMAFIYSLGLIFFQQFSGIYAIIFYTNNIFQSAGSIVAPAIATIIVGAVQPPFTYISSILFARTGRRILLLLSCVIMAICLIVLGIYFKLQEDGYNVTTVGWIPLVFMILFIIAFSLGYGPIPWMMMAELFTAEYRGTGSVFLVIFNWCLVFIVTFCFPIMKLATGIYSCFWLFASIMILSVFFVLFLIPETKGKTVSEIQAILSGKRA